MNLLRKPKAPARDYFREREALSKAFMDLVERAGIAREIERCDAILEPNYFDDQHLPPLFTEARTEAQDKQRALNFERYKARLRSIIFAVQDVEVRRHLIMAERKLWQIKVKSFQHDLDNARRELQSVRYLSSKEVFTPALMAGVVSLAGWHFGGAMWGTAAAVFAVVSTLYQLVDVEQRRRDRTIEAENELSRVRSRLNQVVKQEVFALVEEGGNNRDDLLKTPVK
jgi:hypothetical protein